MRKKLLVIGGDRRMEYAAERLSAAFDVYTCGFLNSPPIWDLKQADILVLPYPSFSGEYLNMPLSERKIPAVSALDLLRYGGTLFGCGFDSGFLSYCSERCAKVFDFFEDEELTLRTAVLTAEGAVEIILRETDFSVNGSKIMILGFGRVGKACARALSSLGAEITVSARSPEAREEAEKRGYRATLPGDEKALRAADSIINSIPTPVLGRGELSLLKKDAFILDLASKPYGTDFAAAKELGIKAEIAPGLPGKTAPKTAGYLIAESVIKAVEGGDCVG